MKCKTFDLCYPSMFEVVVAIAMECTANAKG